MEWKTGNGQGLGNVTNGDQATLAWSESGGYGLTAGDPKRLLLYLAGCAFNVINLDGAWYGV
jgi:hypothetical protein